MTAATQRTPTPRASAAPRAGERDIAYWAYAALVLSLVFLQKLVVPVSATAPISLPLVVLYGVLGLLMVRDKLSISPVRLAAFGALLTAAVVGQLLVGRSFSTMSLMLFLMLYVPLMFTYEVSSRRYLRLLDVFQGAMLVGAGMVFLQLAMQAALGAGNTLNMEDYIPRKFLLPGYNYSATLSWGAAFIRPNGFFFLEPSFCSLFIASALIIEILFFHRLWRTLFYAVALIGSTGATGIIAVVLAAPFILAKLNARAMLAVIVAAVCIGVVGFATGSLDQLTGRIYELSNPTSSGWQRIVAPLVRLNEIFRDPRYVFTGLGAGNSNELNISVWPVAKVMMEYGALAGIFFMVFMATCMWRSPNRALAFGLFVIFNFTGGFLLVPISVINIVMLICLLTPNQALDVGPRRRAERTPKLRPAPALRASPGP